MSILRVYDPAECDARGVPLDWERCRNCAGGTQRRHCGGGALYRDGEKVGDVGAGPMVCQTCGGHGSLKAAALAGVEARIRADLGGPSFAFGRHRCEGCSHPMSDGTWEYPPHPGIGAKLPRMGSLMPGLPDEGPFTPEEWRSVWLQVGEEWLLSGAEPHDSVGVHWSPCDKGCRHGEPLRFKNTQPDDGTWGYGAPTAPGVQEGDTAGTLAARVEDPRVAVEASWRVVDVRTLGWPHDLRVAKLAVLCLRCWAGRTSA